MALWNLPHAFATLSGNQPASKLDDNFDALAITPQYAIAASGTNAIAITVPIPFTAYAIGMMFTCIAPATNTSGTVTLNVNSVGAVTVVKDNNNSLDLGDIVGGSAVSFYYDGLKFHLLAHRSINVSLGNRIINGAFQLDQRNGGTALTITPSNVYSLDRWAVSGAAGVTGCDVQRVFTAVPTPSGEAYLIRLRRLSGTYNNIIQIAQAIETINCYDLAGQAVTLSFWARAGSAYSGTSSQMRANIRSGTAENEGVNGLTAGTWTGYVQDATADFTLTTGWQRFSLTTTIQSGALEVGVMLLTRNFSGTGSSNDFIDIAGVQLELGASASLFDRRLFTQEQLLCQRYLPAVPPAGGSIIGVGQSFASNTADVFVPFAVFPRVIPTGITVVSPTNFTLTGPLGGVINAATVAFFEGGFTGSRVRVTVASGLTAAGDAVLFREANIACRLFFTGCEL